MKYRKKPVVIEAVQWTGENVFEIKTFCGDDAFNFYDKFCEIRTLEGRHLASKGDFIIKGIKGEFYPCKPDIFLATYEPVL